MLSQIIGKGASSLFTAGCGSDGKVHYPPIHHVDGWNREEPYYYIYLKIISSPGMGASGILLFDYMLELWLNLLLYIQIVMIIQINRHVNLVTRHFQLALLI